MVTSTRGEVAGGGVPATGGHERSGDALIAVGAAHPPVEGGSVQGHGGTALRLFVGLSESQAVEFEQTGQVRPPVGRQRCRYWALKKRADHAALSAAEAWGIEMGMVVLRPVSLTYAGVVELLESGKLYCVDREQWRLYDTLRATAPLDSAGHVCYEIHPAFTLA